MTDSWFTDARFGMFVHWGLYAEPARHEWVQTNEQIAAEEYERRYLDQFDPDLYDPAGWAAAAADAGMRYLVVTAKHHEGFCLWDSKLTDFTARNAPAGRDLLRPMLDAFRTAGLRTGVYYSLLDWHHPDYTIDTVHPLAQRSGPFAAQRLPRHESLPGVPARPGPRAAHRLRSDRRAVAGLLGPDRPAGRRPVDDAGSGQGDRELHRRRSRGRSSSNGARTGTPPGLLAMARSLRPGILVNDRLGLADGYDFVTPEQELPDPASDPVRRHADAVGDLPDVLRVVGLSPRRVVLEVGGGAGRPAGDDRQRRRESVAQRRPDCARGVRRARAGPATGHRRLDAPALPQRVRVRGRPRSTSAPRCRTAWSPRIPPPPTGATCTCWTGRRVRWCFAGSAAGCATCSCSTTPPRSCEVTASERVAAGAGPDDLVLALPPRRPDVAVPVLELFLN